MSYFDDNIERFDKFTLAYIECALWSTNDESNKQGVGPAGCSSCNRSGRGQRAVRRLR